jgi:hypothetical protein
MPWWGWAIIAYACLSVLTLMWWQGFVKRGGPYIR